MIRAVLFDFNGVLVDDEHLHLRGFNAALAPHGLTMTEATYEERYLGFDDRGAFLQVFEDHGRVCTAELLASLIASKAAVYTAMALNELRIFPGAESLLTTLARTLPVLIVSGALRAEIDLALGVMNARACIRHIVAAEDVAACKPDPEGYLTALQWLAREAGIVGTDGVVVIEDSVAGIESARAAGLTVVAVAHTYRADVLERAGAHAVFDSLASITEASLAQLA